MSILGDSLRGLTSFLSSASQYTTVLCSLSDNTSFRGPEATFYSITILRKVLYGEVIWGVDNNNLLTGHSVRTGKYQARSFFVFLVWTG